MTKRRVETADSSCICRTRCQRATQQYSGCGHSSQRPGILSRCSKRGDAGGHGGQFEPVIRAAAEAKVTLRLLQFGQSFSESFAASLSSSRVTPSLNIAQLDLGMLEHGS